MKKLTRVQCVLSVSCLRSVFNFVQPLNRPNLIHSIGREVKQELKGEPTRFDSRPKRFPILFDQQDVGVCCTRFESVLSRSQEQTIDVLKISRILAELKRPGKRVIKLVPK